MPLATTYWRLALYRDKHSTGTLQIMYANLEDQSGNALVSDAGDVVLRNDASYGVTTGSEADVINPDLGTSAIVDILTGTAGDPYTIDFTFSTAVLPYRFALALGQSTVGASTDWIVAVLQSSDGSDWAYVKTAPPGFLFAYDAIYCNVIEGFEGNYVRNRHVGGPGGIFGVVLEDDDIKPGGNVVLLERGSWEPVARTITDAGGAYKFLNLTMDVEYFSLATDENGSPMKEAVGYDHRFPVNAKTQTDIYQTRVAAGMATGALVSLAFVPVTYDGYDGLCSSPLFSSRMDDDVSEITGSLDDGISSVSPKSTHDLSLPATNLKNKGLFVGTPRVPYKQSGFSVECLIAPSTTEDVWVSFIGEDALDEYMRASIGTLFFEASRQEYRYLGFKVRVTPAGDVYFYTVDNLASHNLAVQTSVVLDGSMIHIVFGGQYNGVARLTVNGNAFEFSMAGRGDFRIYGSNLTSPADYITGLFVGTVGGTYHTHIDSDVHVSYIALYNRLLGTIEAQDLYATLFTPPDIIQLSGYDQVVASAGPCVWFNLQGPDEYIGNPIQQFDDSTTPSSVLGTGTIAYQVSGRFGNRMAINFAGKYIMRHIGPGMFANTKERSVVFRMDKAGVILSKQSIFHFVSRDLETSYWTTVLLLEIGTDNKLTYSVSSAYNLGSIVSITFDFLFGAVNNPYHTVITHNGETGVLQLWVNNVLVDTKQLIIRLPRGAVTAVIGHAHDTVITQDGFTGHLADFAGYNRILTEEEIGKDFFGDF